MTAELMKYNPSGLWNFYSSIMFFIKIKNYTILENEDLKQKATRYNRVAAEGCNY